MEEGISAKLYRWRSLDGGAEALSNATTMSVMTEENGPLGQEVDGWSEAERRFGYSKVAVPSHFGIPEPAMINLRSSSTP